jgi:Ca2+-dependent lipid-binding protein
MVSSNAADHLSMKVILSIRCKQLKDLDTFSKSDPICIVKETTKGLNKTWGKTERIMNNLNPIFKT